MSLATKKSSSVAIRMEKKFNIAMSRQQVRNNRMKDNDGKDKILSQCNDASGLKKILHAHDCKILLMRLRTKESSHDIDNSSTKSNSSIVIKRKVTIEINNNNESKTQAA